MENSSSTGSNPLPFSPAARAFFAALDGGVDSSGTSSSSGAINTSSSFIQKRIQTLGWRNRYSQTDRYPIQISCHKFSVRQVQRGELEGTYGTGATVWPASLVLLKYLERHSSVLLKDKRVVDLGAGTGVTSVAAALLGARECVCTDGEPAVVRLARDNVAEAASELASSETAAAAITTGNTVKIGECPVTVQEYWWGGTDSTIHFQDEDASCGTAAPDVILVSDCVLPKLYPIAPLVEALDQLLLLDNADDDDNKNNAPPVAILSYEHRHYPEYHPKQKFVELCNAKNLEVETIPMEQQDPVYSVDDIEIWHVRRRRRESVSR